MEERMKGTLKALKSNESTISMILGTIVVIIAGVLLFNYFKASPEPQLTDESVSTQQSDTSQASQEDSSSVDTYTVKSGEHLWGISQEVYQDGYKWTEIAKANDLSGAYVITTGQELVIPQLTQDETQLEPEISELTQDSSEVLPLEVPAEYQQVDTYTVKAGDSLWHIAEEVYQDGYQWQKIWDANKELVDGHPRYIEIGWELTIPR